MVCDRRSVLCCDCGGGTDYSGELDLPPDTTAPVLWRWDLNLRDRFVELHFSEPVDPATLVPTALHISDRAGFNDFDINLSHFSSLASPIINTSPALQCRSGLAKIRSAVLT